MNCLSPLCTEAFDSIEKRLMILEDNALDIKEKASTNFVVLRNSFETKEAARLAALQNYREYLVRGALVAYQLETVPEGFGMYSNTMQLEQITFNPDAAYDSIGTVTDMSYLSDRNSLGAIQWACIWCSLDELTRIIKVMQELIAELYTLVQDKVTGISIVVGGSKNVWNDQEAEIQASFQVNSKTKYNSTSNVTSSSKIYHEGREITSFHVKKVFPVSEQFIFYAKYESNGDEFTSPNGVLSVQAYSPSFFFVTEDEEYDSSKNYNENRIGTPNPFIGLLFKVDSMNGYLYIKTKYDFNSMEVKDNPFSSTNRSSMQVKDIGGGYKVYRWPNKLGSSESATFIVK